MSLLYPTCVVLDSLEYDIEEQISVFLTTDFMISNAGILNKVQIHIDTSGYLCTISSQSATLYTQSHTVENIPRFFTVDIPNSTRTLYNVPLSNQIPLSSILKTSFHKNISGYDPDSSGLSLTDTEVLGFSSGNRSMSDILCGAIYIFMVESIFGTTICNTDDFSDPFVRENSIIFQDDPTETVAYEVEISTRNELNKTIAFDTNSSEYNYWIHFGEDTSGFASTYVPLHNNTLYIMYKLTLLATTSALKFFPMGVSVLAVDSVVCPTSTVYGRNALSFVLGWNCIEKERIPKSFEFNKIQNITTNSDNFLSITFFIDINNASGNVGGPYDYNVEEQEWIVEKSSYVQMIELDKLYFKINGQERITHLYLSSGTIWNDIDENTNQFGYALWKSNIKLILHSTEYTLDTLIDYSINENENSYTFMFDVDVSGLSDIIQSYQDSNNDDSSGCALICTLNKYANGLVYYGSVSNSKILQLTTLNSVNDVSGSRHIAFTNTNGSFETSSIKYDSSGDSSGGIAYIYACNLYDIFIRNYVPSYLRSLFFKSKRLRIQHVNIFTEFAILAHNSSHITDNMYFEKLIQIGTNLDIYDGTKNIEDALNIYISEDACLVSARISFLIHVAHGLIPGSWHAMNVALSIHMNANTQKLTSDIDTLFDNFFAAMETEITQTQETLNFDTVYGSIYNNGGYDVYNSYDSSGLLILKQIFKSAYEELLVQETNALRAQAIVSNVWHLYTEIVQDNNTVHESNGSIISSIKYLVKNQSHTTFTWVDSSGQIVDETNDVSVATQDIVETWQNIVHTHFTLYKLNHKNELQWLFPYANGGVNSGPKRNWDITFLDLETGVSICTTNIRSDQNGLFEIPYYKWNNTLFEIHAKCIDASGVDMVTNELSNPGEELRAVGISGMDIQVHAISSIF